MQVERTAKGPLFLAGLPHFARWPERCRLSRVNWGELLIAVLYRQYSAGFLPARGCRRRRDQSSASQSGMASAHGVPRRMSINPAVSATAPTPTTIAAGRRRRSTTDTRPEMTPRRAAKVDVRADVQTLPREEDIFTSCFLASIDSSSGGLAIKITGVAGPVDRRVRRYRPTGAIGRATSARIGAGPSHTASWKTRPNSQPGTPQARRRELLRRRALHPPL